MSHPSTPAALLQRRPKNPTHVACPHVASDKTVSGWYKFNDSVLSPEVLYGSWPPQTTLKLGGRTMTIARPVTLKLRLLEPEENRLGWSQKPQHEERVNLGEYHVDFEDTEVAYSISKPQTHIWLCGYAIHMDELEKLTFTSYNVTVRIAPSALPSGLAEDVPPPEKPGKQETSQPQPQPQPQTEQQQQQEQQQQREPNRFWTPAAPWPSYASHTAGLSVAAPYPYRPWVSFRYAPSGYPAYPYRLNGCHHALRRQASALPEPSGRNAHPGCSSFPCFRNFPATRTSPVCTASIACTKPPRIPSKKPPASSQAPAAPYCRSPATTETKRPCPYTLPRKTSKTQDPFIAHPFTVQTPTYVGAPCGNDAGIARYHFTATPLNDCERVYQIRDTYDVEVDLSHSASPTSQRPLFPPPLPYEVREWVFPAQRRARSAVNVGNRKRLAYPDGC